MNNIEDGSGPSPLRRRLVREVIDSHAFSLATAADVHDLAWLFAEFFQEASYSKRGIVYDIERAEEWLKRVIESGSCPHIVARSNGTIVGSVSYGLDDTFCEKPIAILHILYVIPSHRKSAIGKILVALAVDLAIGDGAVAFHAPLASGMSETTSLINLFKQAGFEVIGTIMGKGLSDGR